jgi:RHS repeat-associated protein
VALSCTYDAGSRLTLVTDTADPHRPIAFTYDPLDRLLTETTSLGTVTYSYDTAGCRTAMTVAGQTPVAYTHDANARLRTITQAPLNPVAIDYDAANRRTLLTLPNGVSTEYQYDLASRLTALLYRNGLGPLGELTYQYDAAGNRSSVGGSVARTLVPEAVTASSYDAANRQLTFGSIAQAFDDNGNLLTQTDGSGTLTYTWDARNRLVALNSPTLTASFAYDGLGRRAQRTINSVLTQYRYDGLDAVMESSGGNTTSYLRTLGIDEALVRTEATDSTHYLGDALGSSVALTTAGGSVGTTYTYAPFGETTTAGPASANPFRFTGREDDGTGLYYYRARYYDPMRGRFVAEDPFVVAMRLAALDAHMDSIGEVTALATNGYEYAGGNPIVRLDPFGLDWIYSQSTGNTYRLTGLSNLEHVGKGYSGSPEGLNNPPMQNQRNVGPIPQGLWGIGPQGTHTTQSGTDLHDSMRLWPRPGTDTYGRGGFLLHRGNMLTMNSSTGCIVLPLDVLNKIGRSGDRRLRVVP